MNVNLKILITVCLVGLFISSCGSNTRNTAPWEELSWLDKGSSKIIVRNIDNLPRKLKITYFNKSTAEEIIKEFDLKNGESDSLSFEIFRPEMIRLEFDDNNYFTFIIPTMDMDIEISDDVKYAGDHSDDYIYLRKFGGHELANGDYDQVRDDYIVPSWLEAHLKKIRSIEITL